MKEKKVSTDFIRNALLVILLLLSFFATVVKILTGFDIDEAYALAMPYRMLQGDRLFADMWEVHQTSSFLPYLFIRLFSFFSSDMTGLVVYMRCVTAVIHFGMSVVVFFSIRHWTEDDRTDENRQNIWTAAVLAMMYYSFMPKWMLSLDFSMQQLWFFTLFLIFLLKGIKRPGFLALSGLMLALDVLAYPSMAVLYPVTLLLLFFREKKISEKKEAWKSVLWFTLGCVGAAGIFFIYICSYMSLSELLASVPKIFMDGAHQYDAVTKLSLYGSQWLEVFVQTLILTVPAFCVSIAVYYLYQKSTWGRNCRERFGVMTFGLLFCILFEAEVSALITFAGIFVSWGPFRLQVRYIIQFVMAGILFLCGKKHTDTADKENDQIENLPFSWLWWLSFAAFAGILLASNVGPTSSASYLVIGNLLFAGLTITLAKKQGKAMEALAYTGALLFLTSLLMCKGFYMRNTEYVPGDITQGLSKMEEGPLAGIYVRNIDYARYLSDYHTIKEKTAKDDTVLFMGTESLSNLYTAGRIVSPTTISTPAFNEQWVEYFTLYPQKIPTVIFLAKNTVDNREKFFAKNPFGIWISKYYDVECMEETESLCILRKR